MSRIMLEKICYLTMVRFKPGEVKGLIKAASDITERILPYFIIPPMNDENTSDQPISLSDAAIAIGRKFAKEWGNRIAIIDTQFLLKKHVGSETYLNWLPVLFKNARSYGATLIPSARIADVLGVHGNSFKEAINPVDEIKFVFKFEQKDLVDAQELEQNIEKCFEELNLTPSQCIAVIDFDDSELEDTDISASSVWGAIETIQAIGSWNKIAWVSSNFPYKNPSKEGSLVFFPRNNSKVWEKIQSQYHPPKHCIFGDYCADTAKIVFGKKGKPIPIPHVRVCVKDGWLLGRGEKNIPQRNAMKAACAQVVGDDRFPQKNSSSAANEVTKIAKGLIKAGNASNWRALNTTLHVTRIVSDLGIFYDFQIGRVRVKEDETLQTSLPFLT